MILDLHGFGEQLLAGTWMTLKLSLAAVCVGLLLGLLGAIAKTSKYAALRFLGGTYTTIVRGVPETLWVLMIYFGTVSGLNALGDLFGKPDLALSPFAAGTLALGLCFGAYATEVFRGALLSIPRGHREAGQALGLSPGRIFWRIVLPQIWRVALPGLGNLYLILLKDTALDFLPMPTRSPALATIDAYRHYLDTLADAYPVLEWGLRWCELHAPRNSILCLLHRDYRTGNYLASEQGLEAVLDWEFTGWGDPCEDLGWFTARCWRFTRPDLEAGGIGQLEDFLGGYHEVSPLRIERSQLHYWQVMATLRWAVIALQQGQRHLSGEEPSIELALTARLLPELELDILHMTGAEAP
ncbi:ABC transporter permease subunit [Pseudomonas aeruginosa]|nr:ABC transporter permease subunit [Pseudomonas aeruginosa]